MKLFTRIQTDSRYHVDDITIKKYYFSGKTTKTLTLITLNILLPPGSLLTHLFQKYSYFLSRYLLLQTMLQDLKDRFQVMSLKKKFIFAFLLITVLTIVISIFIIQNQISIFKNTGVTKFQASNNQDHLFANGLSAKSIRSAIVSTLYSLYSRVTAIEKSFKYFTDNRSAYSPQLGSLPIVGVNSTFIKDPDPSKPALYFVNGTTTGYQYPQFSYLDTLLPRLLLNNRNQISRISLIFMPNNAPQNSVVATIPAIKRFSLSASQIKNFNSTYNIGEVTFAPGLVSMGTKLISQVSGCTVIIYFSVKQSNLADYRTILYFPESISGYIYTDPTNNSSQILTASRDISDPNKTALQILSHNMSFIYMNSTTYMVAVYNFPETFRVGSQEQLLNIYEGPSSIFLLIPQYQMYQPLAYISNILVTQNSVLQYVFLITAVVSVAFIAAFSYIAARSVAYPINKLTTAIKNYLKGSPLIDVTIALHSFKAKHEINILVKNTIRVLEEIQEQKEKYIPLNLSNQKPCYPDNQLDSNFLMRTCNNSQELWTAVLQQMQFSSKKFQ